MRPTLRQLEYFVAVAETRNFRAAAELCWVTQPALSTQIQALERGLGVRLFERDRRRVHLTDAGTTLLPRARSVLGAVDDIVAGARGFQDPRGGTLRLGVIPTVAPYFLPRVMPALRRHFPDLRVLLREDRTDSLVADLENGHLDLLVLALEARLSSVQTTALFEDPFALLVPVTHRLAARKRVKVHELAEETVLLLEDGHCLRDQALAVCSRARAKERDDDFRASSLGTLTQMVASGLGITLLPELAVRVEVRGNKQLTVVSFARPRPVRTIGLAWRPSSPRKKLYRELARLLSAD